MKDWTLTGREKTYVRDLAKRQQEYAMLPIMKEREARWYRHNDLQGGLPMINFETWTCENDLLEPPQCQSEAGQLIELQIKREILNHEAVGDDRVVSSCFTVPWALTMVPFNLPIESEHALDGKGRDVAYRFLHPIRDLRADLHKLQPSAHGVDREGTLSWKALVEDTLGDILPVRMGMRSLVCCLSQYVVHLMGMETMMLSMVDYPDEFHQVMQRLSQDYISYFKWLEKEGLLFLNNGNDWLCQGSFGFTRDLPGSTASAQPVTTNDVWGYMDSQESVGMSPRMFEEFFFPSYLEVARNFGLLSYGCCEPVHAYWATSLSRLPNLRKISISPWCDEAKMGEALRGSRTIYHRKPSPNFIGVGKQLDEEAFRGHIRHTLECARGCQLEFSFRDVYTLEGNIGKPRRAVQIVRELVEEHWK
ncbi:MAG: hypothetical protein NT154_32355 [Verrucomicrobia bacterium]|nr:hypothetical protein [Verrucomicrobiota bacterium]